MDSQADPLSGAYRAVWRWHFYAGVLVMPVLMLLALTGALYLFKNEIEGVAYREMIRVPASAVQAPPEQWLAAAQSAAGPGRVTNILMPARPDETLRIEVSRPDGVKKTAFVNPHTAGVTGVTPAGGIMEVVKGLHSLSLLGQPFNILVEIVAGWAIILFATGLYLWWPRGRGVAIVTLTTTDVAHRPFWRDLHALIGVYVGAIVLFLAVTGMPWSAIWGDRFLDVMRDSGLGRPKPPVAAFHHAKPQDMPVGVGWTMDHAVMQGRAAGSPSLARVLATAEARHLPRPYTVNIPESPDVAWTVARETRQAQQARSLYIDAPTGAVQADIRWSQFGVGAKAFEWGIAVHQGMQYGQLNRIVMLLGCIGVWVLAISGGLMWWKRRPPSLSRGRMGAPPAPPGARIRFAVWGIVLPLSLLYPMTGLSLVVALILDRATSAARQALKPTY